MSTRLERFETLKQHAWLGRLFKKLSRREIQLASHFLKLNEDMSKNEFKNAVDRLFLDLEEKPKNWKLLTELLFCCL